MNTMTSLKSCCLRYTKVLKKLRSNIHLKISNRSVEGIVSEATLLIQELAGLAVDWRAEQTIVEALLQLLETKRNGTLVMIGKKSKS